MSETNGYSHDSEAADKLRKLAKEINIAMLTTVDDEGNLRSRPMATNGEVEFDGDLWFFTSATSHKVDEVQRQSKVNVSFADPKTNTYISLSGNAELIQDRAKIDELWRPILKAWFPKGKDDPDVALLKVSATRGEFWDAPSGAVATAIGLVKALATGERPGKIGDHEKVAL